MEIKKERVLAYTLARTINNDELADVSGGGGMTSKQTLRPTLNGGIRTTDVFVDISVDW